MRFSMRSLLAEMSFEGARRLLPLENVAAKANARCLSATKRADENRARSGELDGDTSSAPSKADLICMSLVSIVLRIVALAYQLPASQT
jgi:hypothetical protein